jgi:predicted phosphodiesterase
LRAAALYDIHGNLPALEAVLVAVEAAGPDLIVFGGDVAAGPFPLETIERLRMSIFTRESPDARVRALLVDVIDSLVVCGHTHMQFDRTVDGVRIVNAGSVGLPYGTADACWALVEDGEVEFRRTTYDRGGLRRSSYAKVDAFLEEHSEEEAIEFFERQAAATGA